MHVGLVAGVEDDGIARRVEDPVQGHGEFDDAEVGAEVTTGARDLGDEEGADLVGQGRDVAGRQGAQVRGFVDALQQGHARPLVAGRHDDGGAGRHRSLKQWCNAQVYDSARDETHRRRCRRGVNRVTLLPVVRATVASFHERTDDARVQRSRELRKGAWRVAGSLHTCCIAELRAFAEVSRASREQTVSPSWRG